MEITDISETLYDAMKRLDREVEQTAKINDRLYVAGMGAVFVALGLLFFLLHLLLTGK